MTPRASLGRVLIADEDGVRKSLTAALSRAGFEVVHMRTGGLAVIRHYKPRYGAGVYCAVLSGEDDEATREGCLAAGADEVFCKPVPAAELRRRLTEVVRALRASAAGERSA